MVLILNYSMAESKNFYLFSYYGISENNRICNEIMFADKIYINIENAFRDIIDKYLNWVRITPSELYYIITSTKSAYFGDFSNYFERDLREKLKNAALIKKPFYLEDELDTTKYDLTIDNISWSILSNWKESQILSENYFG